MISNYNFDNANVDGDKEAVIIPNIPTLINKLSANETNGIRNKINEIIALVNPIANPIAFLELRLKFKGEGNILPTLQVGDIVHGFKEAGVIWDDAIYNGGDVADRSNYTPIYPGNLPFSVFDGIIGVTPGFTVGQQVFTLPTAAAVKTVYLAHKLQYKKTAVNASLINIWEQTAPDEITLTQGTLLNNYLYIELL